MMDWHSLEAWISHVYMANINRGDQSSKPLRQASRTEEMKDPVKWAVRFDAGAVISGVSEARRDDAYLVLAQCLPYQV